MNRACGLTLSGLIAAMTAGCILPHAHHGGDATRPMPAVGPTLTVLPPVGRDDSQADPDRHPLTGILGDLAPRPEVSYRGLDPLSAECLAARNASVARQLDEKRRNLLAEEGHHPWLHETKYDREKAVLVTALAYEAAEVRNTAASKAAEGFFHLAQAEAQAHLLRLSRAEVDAALESTRVQRERGLPVLAAYQALTLQQIELRDKAETTARSIAQLNGQLKEGLALGPDCDTWSIWPVLNWDVIPIVPDPHAAVALGLARRPQVQLLRYISANLDETIVPLVQSLLSTLNPLLSIEISPHKLKVTIRALSDCVHHLEAAQVTALRLRFERFRAQREREIADEIRQAVLDIDSALHRVVIAQDRYRSRRDEVARLETKSGRGLTPASELRTARLDLIQARSIWVDQVIAWNLARVRLETAQGTLAARCGHCVPTAPTPPSCGPGAGAAP